jgi:antitoxin HicB
MEMARNVFLLFFTERKAETNLSGHGLKTSQTMTGRLLEMTCKPLKYGWPIGMPLCRSIKSHKGLWEVRSNLTGGRIARVLFCFEQSHLVLLHGFIKKSQKTPARDLDRAVTRMKGDDSMDKKHIGSSLGDFLKEEGRLEQAQTVAVKRVLAWQIEQIMKEQKITKVEMANRMGTSRSQLDRFLDPENDKIQLDTLQRAAKAVGKELRLELV